jgi:hypothetical protein
VPSLREQPLTDANGKMLRCESCKRPAVRMFKDADGKDVPTCVTEAEGRKALDLAFAQYRARQAAEKRTRGAYRA